MTCWLLDDGPLGLLVWHADEARTWPASTLHVVREVANSKKLDRLKLRPKLLGLQDAADEPIIRVHDGAAEMQAILHGHLRPEGTYSNNDDLGEHASIALCLTQLPDAVFVTMDKRAAFMALAELGPARVATPFDVWFWLRERSLISAEQRSALDRATLDKDRTLRMPYRFANP